MYTVLKKWDDEGGGSLPTNSTPLITQNKKRSQLEAVLMPFFKKYDADGNGTLDMSEWEMLCRYGSFHPHTPISR